MSKLSPQRFALAGLLAAALLLLACGGQSEDRCSCPCPGDPRQLSGALLSRLAAARAYHHQADLLLARDDLAGAIAKVSAILELDLAVRWPEAEEVRLDAVARLAKLLARQGAEARALTLVDAELAKRPRASFYAANLHSVRGELLEAQVKTLDRAGKKDEAKALARRALAAFEASIRINKTLQRELRAPGSRPTSQPRSAGGKR